MLRADIARCPEHGLHGERDECFDCGGPVEQVPMVEASAYHEARARVVEYEDFIANDPRVRLAFSTHRAARAFAGHSPLLERPDAG